MCSWAFMISNHDNGLGLFCACFGLCFGMFPRRLQTDMVALGAVSAKAPF